MSKMAAKNKQRKYARISILAIAMFIAALACLVLAWFGRQNHSPWLFAAGLALLLLDQMLIFLIFILPMVTALRFILTQDFNSEHSEQIIASSFSKNALINYILKLVDTMNRQKEQEYSLEILRKKAELDALQSQINPHFLYNTLDSIRGQLLGADLDDAAEIIEALSNLFRYSISSKTVYNTLEQELENIQNYMRIIEYRFGNRIQFREVIEEDCAYILNCEMPKLTLQPIIENAIKHGLSAKGSGGLITVRAFVYDEGLHIQVSDNGAGIPGTILDELNHRLQTGSSAQHGKGSDIGLANVNERIRILYGRPYGLHVQSDEGLGTDVHIHLPVQLTPANEALNRLEGSI